MEFGRTNTMPKLNIPKHHFSIISYNRCGDRPETYKEEAYIRTSPSMDAFLDDDALYELMVWIRTYLDKKGHESSNKRCK